MVKPPSPTLVTEGNDAGRVFETRPEVEGSQPYMKNIAFHFPVQNPAVVMRDCDVVVNVGVLSCHVAVEAMRAFTCLVDFDDNVLHCNIYIYANAFNVELLTVSSCCTW